MPDHASDDVPASDAGGVGDAVAADLGWPRSIDLLGSGGDHDAWLVDADGDEWVVRVPRRPSTDGDPSGALVHELTEHIRRSVGADVSAWVPEHRLVGSAGWVAHRHVEGRSLQDLVADPFATVDDLSALGRQLGRFIVAIEDVRAPPGVPVDDVDPVEWLDEVDSLAEGLAPVLGAERRDRVRRFAAEPFRAPSRDELAVCHNDLGAEHVIIDPTTGRIAGVIDWSDAAVSDPAGDVGRILRDLGDDAMAAALATMPEPQRPDRARRARWYARCLIVEDLDFAARARPDLLAHALDAFDRLYPST